MPVELVIGLLVLFVAVLTVQCLLIWAAAKIIDAPNNSFKDALKLAASISLLLLVCYGGYQGLARAYEPQGIPSSWWIFIAIGFCVQIVASFWLTMNILGIGLIRAIILGLLTNAVWKILGALVHSLG